MGRWVKIDMKMESKFKEKEISLEIFGHKAEILASDELFSKCEDIKVSASCLLEKIKENAEIDAEQTVTEFLSESIKELIGENPIAEIFDRREPSITELTGVLCYIIAEIGGVFNYMAEEVCDEE